MPSAEPAKLEWIKAINRKTLSKRVFVCSEHFVDGKPTERNPYPKLKLGYENKATPGRRKLLRKHLDSKKPRIDIADQLDDDNSIQSESRCANSDICEDDILPEAICDINVDVHF